MATSTLSIHPGKKLHEDLFDYVPSLQSLVGRLAEGGDDRLFGLFAPWGCGKTTALGL